MKAWAKRSFLKAVAHRRWAIAFLGAGISAGGLFLAGRLSARQPAERPAPDIYKEAPASKPPAPEKETGTRLQGMQVKLSLDAVKLPASVVRATAPDGRLEYMEISIRDASASPQGFSGAYRLLKAHLTKKYGRPHREAAGESEWRNADSSILVQLSAGKEGGAPPLRLEYRGQPWGEI